MKINKAFFMGLVTCGLLLSGCTSSKGVEVAEKSQDMSGQVVKLNKNNILDYVLITAEYGDYYEYNGSSSTRKNGIYAYVRINNDLLHINADFEATLKAYYISNSQEHTHEMTITATKVDAQNGYNSYSSFTTGNPLEINSATLYKYEIDVKKADGEAKYLDSISTIAVDLNLYNFRDYFSFYSNSRYSYRKENNKYQNYIFLSSSPAYSSNSTHNMICCKDVSITIKFKYQNNNSGTESYSSKTFTMKPTIYGYCIYQFDIETDFDISWSSRSSFSIESISGTIFESALIANSY